MYWLLVLSLLGLISHPVFVSSLVCEYYNSTECGLAHGGPCEASRRNMTCDPDEANKIHSCYAVWRRPNDSDQQELLHLKGCFLNDKGCVGQDTCIEKKHGKQHEGKPSKTLYCCCTKDFCNQEYLWDPVSTTTAKPALAVGVVAPPHRPGSSSVLVFTIVPIACTLVFMLAWFVHRRVLKKPLQDSQSGRTDEENILLDKSEHINAPSVTLVEVKAAGRFGHVWKAAMAGHTKFVAVKILPFRERASWQLEQDVYSLPLMSSTDWILNFYGARRVADGEHLQLWLISEFLEQGSLYDYLKGNVLTWNELFKISVTMCQGLAFIHEEIEVLDKGHKPAVAHRDFKSKNVLLRPDLTACLADFGLAHIFYPNVPVGTCHGQVGTRRYMAPEVLEGAVSFTRDNFQRIDMYACALVLWELASRCSAQKAPVGEYRLPFEEYIGQSPTLEEMQDVVVAQRKRPTIRNDWTSHPGLRILVDAMRDAWDQDSEARISASCIVERMNAISNKIIL